MLSLTDVFGKKPKLDAPLRLHIAPEFGFQNVLLDCY